MDGLEASVTAISADYLVAASLEGYATEEWVNGNNFALAADVAVNTSAIAGNLAAIGANALSINDNVTSIGTNATSIGTNQTGISSNGLAVAANTSSIGTNATDIGTNATDVGTNATDIATNTGDVTTLEDATITSGTTWTVGPSSSADYATLRDAMNAARTKEIRGNVWLNLQLESGTHTNSLTTSLNHPQGSRIRIEGDQANPSSVVYEYSGSGSALDLGYGNTLNHIYGMTVRYTGTATGVAGLYIHDGAYLVVGGLVLEDFTGYGITVRNSAGMRALDDSLTAQDNGSYGIDVRDQGFLYARGAQSLRNASGFIISGGSFARLDDAWAEDNTNYGIYASYGTQVMASDSKAIINAGTGYYSYGNSHIRAHTAEAIFNGAHGFYASDASIYARYSTSEDNGSWGYYAGANSLVDANYSLR
ncbi:MAG TPA: hypothetical protein EYQ31_15655, partial [Candidatus Handelsmanbacteria bacterium]|nr:hypothetical protein [Candidatus Handelsmanbacteria bacterium]